MATTTKPKPPKTAPKTAPRAASPEPTAAKPDHEIVQLFLTQIVRSDLNPRKRFEPDGLAALAESIADRGLLQNLVVRPLLDDAGAQRRTFDTDEPQYELLAGERRHRALWLLWEQGRWPEDRTVTCRLLPAGEAAEGRALALIENLQRQDISALEEGDAFAELVAIGWDTARIAAAIRRSRRHVQMRLALTRLDAEARAALADGRIDFARARALAGLPAELQRQGVAMATAEDDCRRPATAEQLRARLMRELVPAARALTPPPEDTPGLVVVGEGAAAEPHFGDVEAFRAWQDRAVAAEAERLKGEGWAFVETIFGGRNALRWCGRYQVEDCDVVTTTDRAAGGAVIVRDHGGDAEIIEGVLHAAAPDDADDDAAADKPEASGPDSTARRQAEAALQAALDERVRGDVRLALRLLVFGAGLDYRSGWALGVDAPGGLSRGDLEAAAPELAALLPAAEAGKDDDADPDEEVEWPDPAAAWTAIGALEAARPAAIDALVARATAQTVSLRTRPWDLTAPALDAGSAAALAGLGLAVDPALTAPAEA